MARRDPRPRRRAFGLSLVVLTAALAAAIAPPAGRAQPAPAAPAPPPTNDAIERARDLYRSGEAAMKDGRFDDAARDYGASYELSKDPALFFKIGRAHERAGRCETALIYFARYLREGNPTAQFTALTREHIAACGGSASATGSAPPPPSSSIEEAGSAAPAPTASPGARPTAGPGSSTPSGAGPTAADSTTSPPAPAPAPADAATAGSGSAVPAPPPVPVPPTRQKVAWLLTGGTLALVTLGGVLAYAAGSSENDVRDLYAGLAGRPPTFDAETRRRYDELVDDGRRFEHLSWAAFGLAGATAISAALLFTLGGEDAAQHARAPAITPVVTGRGAGIAVRF